MCRRLAKTIASPKRTTASERPTLATAKLCLRSCDARASKTLSPRPSVRAALCTSLSCGAEAGFPGLESPANRVSLGIASLRSSTLFPLTSGELKDRPVRLKSRMPRQAKKTTRRRLRVTFVVRTKVKVLLRRAGRLRARHGDVHDNTILMSKDPDYLKNLQNLTFVRGSLKNLQLL